MRKLIYILIPLFLLTTIVYAAPPVSSGNILRTILPETTNTYSLGSTAKQWLNIFTQNASTTNLTLNGSNVVRGETVVVAASNSLKSQADYVADGTADEVTINAALTEVAGSGGRVVLLDGTYSITSDILVPNNTTLEGQGASTTIQIAASVGNSTIKVITNKDASLGNSGIRVTNLRIDGSLTQSVVRIPNTQTGVALINSSNSSVDNLHIDHLGNIMAPSCIGILLQGVYDIRVKNNFITDTVDGINTSGADASSKRLIIEGNHINGTSRDYGINLFYVNDSIIANNVIRETYNHGIFFNTSASNNIVTGNTIENVGRAINNVYSGIAFEDSVDITDNTVSNNHIKKATSGNIQKYGIVFEGASPERNKIINNNLYSSGQTGDLLVDGVDTVVAGNTTTATPGAYSFGATNIVTTGIGTFDHIVETVPTLLKLDQSTPQTITASPILNWGTTGRIPFYSATKTLTDDTNLFYDGTNHRLGLGTTTPATRFHLYGSNPPTTADYAQIDTGLNFTDISAPPDLTGKLSLVNEAGNVNAGVHYYYVTYYNALGETTITDSFPRPSVTTDASHGKVDVTLPISSDPQVLGRKLYRSKAGGAYYTTFLVATIANNTDATYRDNIADSALGTAGAYFRPNTTNSLILKNGSQALLLDSALTVLGASAGNLATSLGAGMGVSTIIGQGAGASLTSGNQNTLLGPSAGWAMTSGISNVLLGSYTGGASASIGITDGYNNVAIGHQSTQANTHLSTNIGSNSGQRSSGGHNTFIGSYSGYGNATANTAEENTMLGSETGYLIQTGANKNILIGYKAGNGITTGNSNLVIGYDQDTTSATANNELNIGGAIKGNLSTGSIQIAGATTLATTSVTATLTTAGRNEAVANVTSNYTVGVNDQTVVASSTAAMTITLPAATGSGRSLMLKNTATSTVTIDGNGSDKIDDTLTKTMSQWDSRTLRDCVTALWCTEDKFIMSPLGEYSNSASQTLTTAGTAYPLALDTESDEHLLTHDTVTNNSRIYADITGTYEIIFSIIVNSPVANKHIALWPKLNGTTNIANANTYVQASISGEQVISAPIIFDMNAGDYVEMYGESDQNNFVLQATAAASNYPASPSTLLTIKRIR